MDQITAAIPSLQEIHDVLPVPDTIAPVTDPDVQEIATSLTEEPTLSHQLAMQDHENKGAAQQDHDVEEVANLGWNEPVEKIASPLVGGMKNDDLWILVRRFNQVSCHCHRDYPAILLTGSQANVSPERGDYASTRKARSEHCR